MTSLNESSGAPRVGTRGYHVCPVTGNYVTCSQALCPWCQGDDTAQGTGE